MKLTLLFTALFVALSLVFGEAPIGDASGCVVLPLAMVLAFGGAALVIVFAKERVSVRIAFAIFLILLGFHIAGGPLYYRGAAIESRVVDDAGDPVADAEVVATWETNRGDVFARVATRTDRGGSFTIAPWGPRPRLPLTYLDRSQPSIRVSAPGFAPAEERDESLGERRAAVAGEQWSMGEVVVYKR